MKKSRPLSEEAVSVGTVLARSDISEKLAKRPQMANNRLYKQAVIGGFMAAIFLVTCLIIWFFWFSKVK